MRDHVRMLHYLPVIRCYPEWSSYRARTRTRVLAREKMRRTPLRIRRTARVRGRCVFRAASSSAGGCSCCNEIGARDDGTRRDFRMVLLSDRKRAKRARRECVNAEAISGGYYHRYNNPISFNKLVIKRIMFWMFVFPNRRFRAFDETTVYLNF